MVVTGEGAHSLQISPAQQQAETQAITRPKQLKTIATTALERRFSAAGNGERRGSGTQGRTLLVTKDSFFIGHFSQ